jgi:mRNA-degrading endonuclease YafQ of YafQ-DinJ toxin-antitoxin module
VSDKQQEWKVKIENEASTIFTGNTLTLEDKEVIQTWAKFIKKHGPDELQTRPGMWADHALYGDRKGERASRFSSKGRIIYRVDDKEKTVIVTKITNDHDYKKEER